MYTSPQPRQWICPSPQILSDSFVIPPSPCFSRQVATFMFLSLNNSLHFLEFYAEESYNMYWFCLTFHSAKLTCICMVECIDGLFCCWGTLHCGYGYAFLVWWTLGLFLVWATPDCLVSLPCWSPREWYGTIFCIWQVSEPKSEMLSRSHSKFRFGLRISGLWLPCPPG